MKFLREYIIKEAMVHKGEFRKDLEELTKDEEIVSSLIDAL
jgi:rubrerythrin